MSEPTPARPITKELLRELGDWRVDKEGRQLAETGRVQNLHYTDALLTGTVGQVRACLKLALGTFGIENQCSCRQAREQGIICAHVVALVYAYLYPWKIKPPATPAPAATPPPPPATEPTGPLRIIVDGTLGGLTIKVTGGTNAERQAISAAEPLRTETQIGFFLANVLPRWRERWDVSLGERLQALLLRCEYLAPEITIRPTGNDWLAVDLKFKDRQGATPLTPVEARQLLQKGIAHHRLPNGRIGLVPTAALQEFDEVIFDCAAQQTGTELRVPRRFADYLTHAAQENKWQPPAALTPPAELTLPGNLGAQLRPYQRAGVNWLQLLGANGLGGILADEMGLGKTVQALAWLAARANDPTLTLTLSLPEGRGKPPQDPFSPFLGEKVRMRGRGTTNKPSLVVCPTSLVTNWQAEAAHFTPGVKTLLLHGSDRQRRFAEVAGHDLIITSYALLRRDIEQYARWELDTVILDEAQHIKNRFSQVAQATKSLKAKNRFVLTGTPMENSLDELWSIFDFLMPGYLGPAKEFKDRYETPITTLNDAAALRRLRQRLRPFVLRRTKAEVAPELPAKIEQVAFCEMTAEQQSVYQTILDQGRREIFNEADQAKQRMTMLTTLLRLRQAACHLGLLPGENQWIEPSAKVDLCMELIDEAISGGHRVLVFSQFTTLLQLIAATLPTPYCYLDGSTVNRAGEVRRFQQSPDIPVFLISLKAGGTGLNLTGADTVIHVDPWWNPAIEEQATARAHRIGQSKIVTSYKLIAQGTVEEKIVRLQEKKKELIANTLATDEAFTQSLTWDELQGLLE
jgi:superfamily II DNA or RNA helicase